MIDVYLFDWGDTLMVDFPGVPGKMCNWDVVEAVDGAKEALEHLSKPDPPDHRHSGRRCALSLPKHLFTHAGCRKRG